MGYITLFLDVMTKTVINFSEKVQMNNQFNATKKGNPWQNYANQVLSGSNLSRT